MNRKPHDVAPVAARDSNGLERAQGYRRLYEWCEKVLEHATEYADDRWYSSHSCFRDYFGSTPANNERHVVNTSTALFVIARNKSPFSPKDLAAFGGHKINNIFTYYNLPDCYDGKTDKGWILKTTVHHYASSWALRALSGIIGSLETDTLKATPGFEDIRKKVDKSCGAIVEFLKNWAAGTITEKDLDHPFFVHECLVSLREIELIENKLELDKAMLAALPQLMNDCANRLAIILYQQLTYCLAEVPEYLDAVSLVCALVAVLDFGDYRIDMPDEVLRAALDAVFTLQRRTGYWEDTQTPLLGQSLGGVGCSSVQIASMLLDCKRTGKFFPQYVDQYNLLLNRLLAEWDRSLPEVGRGWSTDVRRPNNDATYQSWYGFLVFDYIQRMSDRLRVLAAEDLLRPYRTREGAPTVPFKELLTYKNYHYALDTRLIRPWLEWSQASTKEEREKLKKRLECSAILFGPPGTGKTSIAHAVAAKLGWTLHEIGPGDFLQTGMEGIFAQGNEIFARLILAQRAVVLFDELDELVRRRNASQDVLSRFLTTYMLPWLQQLRDRQDIIFLFATNDVSIFDDAIKRYGRIDFVLPIGPPLIDGKLKFIRRNVAPDAFKEIQKEKSKILPQTTIGDLQRALKVASGKETMDVKRFLSVVSDPAQLLIEEPDWEDFKKACTRFAPANEQLQVD